MISATIPINESERLQELYRMSILDTQPDEDFNEIVEVASRICRVPISLITLVDNNRQWFKAEKGLGMAETDRNISFCAHTILGDDLMEVKDAELDERFIGNPLVEANPNISGSSISVGDLDGDGKPDLATCTGGNMAVLRSQLSETPTITGFTPEFGLTGAIVTITGTNFTGATAVSFGGTAAASFNVVSAASF